jgi:hypothetical protein
MLLVGLLYQQWILRFLLYSSEHKHREVPAFAGMTIKNQTKIQSIRHPRVCGDLRKLSSWFAISAMDFTLSYFYSSEHKHREVTAFAGMTIKNQTKYNLFVIPSYAGISES